MSIHAKRNASLIFEHIEMNEAEASDVEVQGFDINEKLDPDIWGSNQEMRPEVRNRLLDVAEDFIAGLPFDVDVEDVKLTGSLATYNWSRFSDVDLHLVVDFSTVDDDEELVKDYFNAKKTVWNLKHEIYIRGYEIEIYVENVGDKHTAQGIYSIQDDEWIKKPQREFFEIDEEEVKKKAASIMSQIEYIEEVAADEPVEAEKLAERAKEKIRKMRQSGLDSDKGIYSVKNVAFKVLRRNGYLEKLSNIKTQSYDRVMSLADL
tara:strand:- start:365 stop:1153 length:789 start_codon:yes stop_codon:yes gene_type:complete